MGVVFPDFPRSITEIELDTFCYGSIIPRVVSRPGGSAVSDRIDGKVRFRQANGFGELRKSGLWVIPDGGSPIIVRPGIDQWAGVACRPYQVLVSDPMMLSFSMVTPLIEKLNRLRSKRCPSPSPGLVPRHHEPGFRYLTNTLLGEMAPLHLPDVGIAQAGVDGQHDDCLQPWISGFDDSS